MTGSYQYPTHSVVQKTLSKLGDTVTLWILFDINRNDFYTWRHTVVEFYSFMHTLSENLNKKSILTYFGIWMYFFHNFKTKEKHYLYGTKNNCIHSTISLSPTANLCIVCLSYYLYYLPFVHIYMDEYIYVHVYV